MIEISKRGMCPRKLPDSMLPDSMLPNVCLQLCGGGYTAGQTTSAMILQRDVERDGVGKYKGVTVKKVAP